MTLTAGDLSLNDVLKRLDYKVVNHRVKANGVRHKSIRKDGRAIRFPDGTITGRYAGVNNLESTTASIVWQWLRATEQIV